MTGHITAASRWRAQARQLRAVAPFVLLLHGCDAEGNVGYWTDSPTPSAAGGSLGLDSGSSRRGTVDAGDAALGSEVAESTSNIGNAGALATGSVTTDACALARPDPSPFEVTVVDTQAVRYAFADGALFPAGRYRIEYVDGCRRYDNTAAWTLHASLLAAGLSAEGRGGCYLIMSNEQAIDLAPGTSGVVVGEGPDPAGAFASYDECVAANRKQAPRDLTLPAGTVAIMNAGDSSPDKTSGEAIGQRSPTYRLTRLDPCP